MLFRGLFVAVLLVGIFPAQTFRQRPFNLPTTAGRQCNHPICSDTIRLAQTSDNEAYYRSADMSNWYEMNDCLVLLPEEKVPKAVIHFIGGFLAGSSVPVAYSSLLSRLSRRGYLVVATPIPPIDLNHEQVADKAAAAFIDCYLQSIPPLLGVKNAPQVPVIGLSHSLGGKLTALIGSNKALRKALPRRLANIYLAFNNYGVQESVAASVDQLSESSPEVRKIIKAIQNPDVQSVIDAAKNIPGAELLREFLNRDSAETGRRNQDAASVGTDGKYSTRGDSDNGSDSSDNRDTNSMYDSAAGNGKDVSKVASEFLNSFDQLSGLKDKISGAVAAAASDSASEGARAIIGSLANKAKEVSGKYAKNVASMEFTPSPEDTWQRILDGYNVQHNYLLQFDDDAIDQSAQAAVYFRRRGCDVSLVQLPGNHLTPNAVVPERTAPVKPAAAISGEEAGAAAGTDPASAVSSRDDMGNYWNYRGDGVYTRDGLVAATSSTAAGDTRVNRDGLALQKELVRILDAVTGEAWESISRRERERYTLPQCSNSSNSNSRSSSGGVGNSDSEGGDNHDRSSAEQRSSRNGGSSVVDYENDDDDDDADRWDSEDY